MSLARPTTPVACTLPLSSISVQEAFNPRRAFRKEPLDRLVASIREQGLLQPILVRPRTDGGDGYWLVAGERRFRACTSLGWTEITALVRPLTDDDARMAALIENIDRADLSPAEEALAARDALDYAGGDKTATASHLGWPASKLEARLLLLTASERVLQAVADGSIHVGHAELLAGLPEAQQDKALGNIIERKVSVADLREQVKGIVIPLTTAIFDTTACATCPFNTQLQGSLFGDAVQGAHCKNKVCFTQKSTDAIEAKRVALADEVGTVALSTEKDAASYTSLVIDGDGGVGKDQFVQCKGCQFFGALIHAKPDAGLGQVERPMCFNLGCHRERVAAYQESIAPAAGPAETVASPQAVAAPPARASGKPVAKPAAKAPPKKGKVAAPAATSGAVRTAMKPAYRATAEALVQSNPKVSLALGILALRMVAVGASIRVNDPTQAPRHGHGKPEEQVAELLAKETTELAELYRVACTALVSGTLVNAQYSRNDVFPPVIAARVVQACEANLAEHFAMSESFLDTQTLLGISGLLTESGFDAWLKAQDDGPAKWKALMAHKKKDLPKAVMAAGYDWSGFVPASVRTVVPRSFVGA